MITPSTPQEEQPLRAENDRMRIILSRIAREIDPCTDIGPTSPVERFATIPQDLRQQFRLLHMELVR
ncbi:MULTISPECIES: hypothetical protein [Rhizobium/Agrobacterium group]|uniref:hypothetical protein n=1 Tax=Rhizobium/Agrobacterium group TaxID=227290 RepID=UPI00030FC2D9|nr:MULTISPECIES: hypothetical protein [Rhizobium/Agrobacterium group]MUO30812.1 hypothetical protein [Agrobacterium vitis]